FGRGMQLAPGAHIDDGLFDIVLIKNVSALRVLRSFNRIYAGTHLALDAVESTRGQQITVEALDETPLLGEMDGEPLQGRTLRLSVQPGVLYMLRT
ncbi:MAG: sphingosine kinase, partial [Anaerolineales bacterium]